MKPVDEIVNNRRISNAVIGADGFSCDVRIIGYAASLIVSWGAGWEHASISPYNNVIPTWDDMCLLKDLIWRDDEAVIQIHPAKAEYVNNMKNALHLWRCTYKEMVLPPSCLVGIRKGQTLEELNKEVKEAYAKAEGR